MTASNSSAVDFLYVDGSQWDQEAFFEAQKAWGIDPGTKQGVLDELEKLKQEVNE